MGIGIFDTGNPALMQWSRNTRGARYSGESINASGAVAICSIFATRG